MAPIARYADGVWDSPPWAGIFVLEQNRGGPHAEGEWSWPDANQLWQNEARDLDTVARAPDVIATGVPATWFLFSETEQGMPPSRRSR